MAVNHLFDTKAEALEFSDKHPARAIIISKSHEPNGWCVNFLDDPAPKVTADKPKTKKKPAADKDAAGMYAGGDGGES